MPQGKECPIFAIEGGFEEKENKIFDYHHTQKADDPNLDPSIIGILATNTSWLYKIVLKKQRKPFMMLRALRISALS